MSCSQRKLMANRENAKKSTGPRTVEGKLKARMNSLKHGMRADVVAMFDEDPDRIEVEKAAWVTDLAPVGHVAARLAERAFKAYLRVTRCERAEEMALKQQVQDAQDARRIALETRVQQVGRELPQNPVPNFRELRGSHLGCKWLAAAWKARMNKLANLTWNYDDSPFVEALDAVEPAFQGDLRGALGDLVYFCKLASRVIRLGGDVGAPMSEIRKYVSELDLEPFERHRENVTKTAAYIHVLAEKKIAEYTQRAQKLYPAYLQDLAEAQTVALATDAPAVTRARQYADRAEASLLRLINGARAATRDELSRDFDDSEVQDDSEIQVAPEVQANPEPAEPTAAADPVGSTNEPTEEGEIVLTKFDPTDAKRVDTPVGSTTADDRPPLARAV
jgi:hypothetical protein